MKLASKYRLNVINSQIILVTRNVLTLNEEIIKEQSLKLVIVTIELFI